MKRVKRTNLVLPDRDRTDTFSLTLQIFHHDPSFFTRPCPPPSQDKVAQHTAVFVPPFSVTLFTAVHLGWVAEIKNRSARPVLTGDRRASAGHRCASKTSFPFGPGLTGLRPEQSRRLDDGPKLRHHLSHPLPLPLTSFRSTFSSSSSLVL